MATLSDCKKLALMIEPDAFKDLGLHNENWRYYRCMMLFLYGTLNGIHDVKGLKQGTKFATSTIRIVCENLSENGIWKNGVAYIDLEDENAWMEIVLCTMVAMGGIKRFVESPSYPVPALPLQMLPQFKVIDQVLLNERILLKETLEQIQLNRTDRESKPYEFTIPKDVFDAQ